MPRFGGPNTFMRLPAQNDAQGLDVAFMGVPLDIGTSWRPGTRFGPKAIRAESAMIRPYNMGTGAAPFESLQCADIGDVAVNTFDLKDSVVRIEAALSNVLHAGAIPMTIGGDHTIALPSLRAISKHHGPVALIHVDAHADINDHMFGEQIAHGTPFRRAHEEGLLAADCVWQIGLRGTGTPEICGLTPPQAVQLIRGLRGLNLVGCELVEVSPPYDAAGNTALVAANLLYEMLCVLPGVKYQTGEE